MVHKNRSMKEGAVQGKTCLLGTNFIKIGTKSTQKSPKHVGEKRESRSELEKQNRRMKEILCLHFERIFTKPLGWESRHILYWLNTDEALKRY